MKREIKFRVWDKDKCIMLDVDQLAFGHDGELVSIYSDGPDFSNDSEALMGEEPDLNEAVLMQYTGLKDKNGREIYEGDVLDCINGDINTSDKAFYPGRCMGQVGFVGASFIVWPRPVVDGHRMHYGCEVLSDGLTKYTWENEIAAGESVVVGNVYANPELLEE